MTDAKKPVSPRQIEDVARPGKSAPTMTSKPVIVANRPMLKDPMMVDEPAAGSTEVVEKAEPIATKPIAKVDVEPEAKPERVAPAAKADLTPAAPAPEKPETNNTTDESSPTDDSGNEPSIAALTAEQQDAEAEKQAKYDAQIQKLAESKQYFLPINAQEKRRTKRFVVLGVLLSVLLALAWVDVALDAGLIQLGSVKPVTHFFSN